MRVHASGTKVGGYTLERVFAEGGMGVLYLARDDQSGEAVLVKFLREAHLGSDEMLARFERESRLCMSLVHPRIVRGLAEGVFEGQPYLVLERLEGRDLGVVLEDGPIPYAQAVQIGIQVCEALGEVHAHGVVHRDLKPENIFLCEGTPLRIKLLDFGVARTLALRLTSAGVVIGTWHYLSPEQARGNPNLDQRSDLWSLGALLYECVAGCRPFEGSNHLALMYQVLSQEPRLLGEEAPDAPKAFCDVVHRCLRKAPEERFSSAQELREALVALSLVDPAAMPESDVRGGLLPTQPAGEDEMRLLALLHVTGARAGAVLKRLAHELSAEVHALEPLRYLVVFGMHRWSGGESSAALRLATAIAPLVQAMALSTTRARTCGGVLGVSALESLPALPKRGLALDAATASALPHVALGAALPDGRVMVSMDALRIDRSRITEEPPPLVGRSEDLRWIVDASIANAAARTPRLLLVRGEAGMGLSSLAATAALHVARKTKGVVMFRSRCDAHRAATVLSVITDALSEVLDPMLIEAARESQGGPFMEEMLEQALQSIGDVLEHLTRERHLWWIVDDAQWMDPVSRDALVALVRARPTLAMTVVFFERIDASSPLAELIPEDAQRTLRPLTREQASELLVAMLGYAPESVLDRAEGNPLFLRQLAACVDAGDASLPASIESAVQQQLDALPPALRDWIKRASIVGRTVWSGLAHELGADMRVLESPRAHELIVRESRSRVAGEEQYKLRSNLLVELAYKLWPDSARQGLHRIAAEWLEAHHETADVVARHWSEANEPARATQSLLAAAKRALGFNLQMARVHACAVLARTTDARLRYEALFVCAASRDVGVSVEEERARLLEMRTLALELSPSERIEAELRSADFFRAKSQLDEALAHADCAITLATPGCDAGLRARSLRMRAVVLGRMGIFPEAEALLAEAEAIARRAKSDWVLLHVLNARAVIASEQGRLAEAVPVYEDVARRAEFAGHTSIGVKALGNAGRAHMLLGRLAEAIEPLQRTQEIALRIGDSPGRANALYNLAVAQRLLHRHDAAQRTLSEAESIARRIEQPYTRDAVQIERWYLELALTSPTLTLPAKVVAEIQPAKVVAEIQPAKVVAEIEPAKVVAERLAQEVAAYACDSTELSAHVAALALRLMLRVGAPEVPSAIARARALTETVGAYPEASADVLSSLAEAGVRPWTEAQAAWMRIAHHGATHFDQQLYLRMVIKRFALPSGSLALA